MLVHDHMTPLPVILRIDADFKSAPRNLAAGRQCAP